MTTNSLLMLLRTETPLHAGAGQSISGIDLPIQRETHTQWPVVFGSSVKGALRAHAECRAQLDKTTITDLFGPDHSAAAGERDNSHAGALMVGDAYLLLLPVRSLQSCFKWVTCPAALDRFNRHANRLGQPALMGCDGLNPSPEKALSAHTANQQLFLEEFRFDQTQVSAMTELAADLATRFDIIEKDMSERLVVVHNDIFSFLVRHATTVNPHIAIDSETKTVKQGQLWSEESLPPECLLYSPIITTASRRRGSEHNSSSDISQLLQTLFSNKPWLQLGGNETTGMGWCHVSLAALEHSND